MSTVPEDDPDDDVEVIPLLLVVVPLLEVMPLLVDEDVEVLVLVCPLLVLVLVLVWTALLLSPSSPKSPRLPGPPVQATKTATADPPTVKATSERRCMRHPFQRSAYRGSLTEARL